MTQKFDVIVLWSPLSCYWFMRWNIDAVICENSSHVVILFNKALDRKRSNNTLVKEMENKIVLKVKKKANRQSTRNVSSSGLLQEQECSEVISVGVHMYIAIYITIFFLQSHNLICIGECLEINDARISIDSVKLSIFHFFIPLSAFRLH